VSIFLYFVLTDCDQLLTSFQEGPYHTQKLAFTFMAGH